MSLLSSKTTTTNTPTYSADQNYLQHLIGIGLQDKLSNPRAALDPLKTAATESINRNYSQISKRLQAKASAQGFGRSGTTLTDARSLELGRAGELGGLESKFAGMQLDYENNLINEGMNFAFRNPGQTSTQTHNPGLGGLISGGLGVASTLFGLNSLLKGGGSLFGGGGGNPLGDEGYVRSEIK